MPLAEEWSVVQAPVAPGRLARAQHTRSCDERRVNGRRQLEDLQPVDRGGRLGRQERVRHRIEASRKALPVG